MFQGRLGYQGSTEMFCNFAKLSYFLRWFLQIFMGNPNLKLNILCIFLSAIQSWLASKWKKVNFNSKMYSFGSKFNVCTYSVFIVLGMYSYEVKQGVNICVLASLLRLLKRDCGNHGLVELFAFFLIAKKLQSTHLGYIFSGRRRI